MRPGPQVVRRGQHGSVMHFAHARQAWGGLGHDVVLALFQHQQRQPRQQPRPASPAGRTRAVAPGVVFIKELDRRHVIRLEVVGVGMRLKPNHGARIDAQHVARPDQAHGLLDRQAFVPVGQRLQAHLDLAAFFTHARVAVDGRGQTRAVPRQEGVLGGGHGGLCIAVSDCLQANSYAASTCKLPASAGVAANSPCMACCAATALPCSTAVPGTPTPTGCIVFMSITW